MEYPPREEKLRDLRLFRLEKRKLQGDLIVDFQCLKGADKKAGEGLVQEHVGTGRGVMAAN